MEVDPPAAPPAADEDRGTVAFEAATAIAVADPAAGVAAFTALLHDDELSPGGGPLHHAQERAVLKLASLAVTLQQADALPALLRDVRPLFSRMPKAKTAKIVRTVIDKLGHIPGSEQQQVDLCNEYVEWCKVEHRAFLRQRIQTRLANLLLKRKEYQPALALLAELESEVKKLDDKSLLVEIFLLESEAHHTLGNLPKAKSALTAARSNANAVYVGPQLQAEIDMRSGSLNADERDFRVAYSYFFEGFEGFVGLQETARAMLALKYMLLVKIMNKQSNEVPAIMNSKNALKFSGRELEAMRAVAKAARERSLKAFDKALEEFKAELVGDELISRHLGDLQTALLEENLCRIIEPFSCVEIARVAQLIELPLPRVEAKLSQMILDKKFKGILDQGAGHLVIFDATEPSEAYDTSLQLIESMGEAVDRLHQRAVKLSVA